VANANYQPDFDIDHTRGMVGEDLVGTFLESVAGSTIEVKTDYRANETGNLYVETMQESRGEWVLSGLAISKATFYCFAGGKGQGFLTIRKDDLLDIVKTSGREVHMRRSGPKSNDTRGWLIRVEDVVARILQPTKVVE